jgi:hypothetical protein
MRPPLAQPAVELSHAEPLYTLFTVTATRSDVTLDAPALGVTIIEKYDTAAFPDTNTGVVTCEISTPPPPDAHGDRPD